MTQKTTKPRKIKWWIKVGIMINVNEIMKKVKCEKFTLFV